MFTELTVEEQYECNGGAVPALTLLKILFSICGGIFVLGGMEGCASEAAKDIEEGETK